MDEHPAIEEAASNVLVVDVEQDADLAPYFAATFGIVDEVAENALRERFKAFVKRFHSGTGAAEYVRNCSALAPRLSPLDLASFRMTRKLTNFAFFHCRIVVCHTLGADLALFWDLRMSMGTGSGSAFLLLPAAAVEDKEAVECVAEWIVPSAKRCNYCELLSLSADEEVLRQLARRLRPRVARNGIKHVDILLGEIPVPQVTGYEMESALHMEVDGQQVKAIAARPSFHDYLGQSQTWVADIVRDYETRRRPLEVCPPHRPVVQHILNAPFPPRLTIHSVSPVRASSDSISVRCNQSNPNITVWLPTNEELLHGILMGNGVRLKADEKRAAYEPAIEIFGGLRQAARAASGVSRKMLAALVEKPRTWGELLGIARAGERTQPEGPDLTMIDHCVDNPVSKAIATERVRAFYAEQHPPSEKAADVLDYWERRGILSRTVRLPKCASCGQEDWVQTIEVGRTFACSKCGKIMELPGKIQATYRLNPLVTRAYKEGMLPVVLTGRFLQQLTRDAFQWIPGVKGSYDNQGIDIDLMACCDGHIVLGQCKTLSDAHNDSDGWKKALRQMRALLKLAADCGAEMLFLACLADRFPAEVDEFAKKNSSETLAVHTFTGPELDRGWRGRKVRAGEHAYEGLMSLHDFLPPGVSLHTKHLRGKGPRKASF